MIGESFGHTGSVDEEVMSSDHPSSNIYHRVSALPLHRLIVALSNSK